MTNQTALLSPTRADHSVDIVRLRYIAAQAENSTTVLDDLRSHLVAVTGPGGPSHHRDRRASGRGRA